MEICWSGMMSSVFLNQVMVYSGEPSTEQVKNSVLLMPVFRFFGDKVTRSGSVRRKNKKFWDLKTDPKKGSIRFFLNLQ